MNLRGLAALALLLVASGMERLAYYGSRSFLALDLRNQGETALSIGTTMTALQGILLVGMLAGGALSFAAGPRATAAAGALLAAVGHLAFVAGAPVVLSAGIVAFGAGLFRPCPYAAAAETLAWDDESPSAPGPHRFAAVAAFASAIYGASSGGSFLGTTISGALRSHYGANIVYSVNGAVMIFATALAATAAVIGWLGRRTPAEGVPVQGPYRMPEPRPAYASPPATTMLGGIAILVLPQVVYLVGVSALDPPFELIGGANRMWLFSINPVVVMIVSVVVFAVFLAGAIQRWTLPPLLFYGAGLVVFAVGLVPVALAGSSSVAVYAIGMVITGAGEALAAGVPTACAAIAVRGRAATLVVAGWFAVSLIVSTVTRALGALPMLRVPFILLSCMLCLGAGAVLLASGRRLHRTFFDPEAPVR